MTTNGGTHCTLECGHICVLAIAGMGQTRIYKQGVQTKLGPRQKKKEIFYIFEICSVREELNTGHLWGRLWPIVSL